jgi:hypothetical protein
MLCAGIRVGRMMSQVTASTTVFCLSADPPAELPPSYSEDHAFDSASLEGATGSHACFVGKISAAGATLRIDEARDPGEIMILHLANGQAIDGHIAWSTTEEAGFVFDSPVDVVSTLARNLARLPAERRRVPRVELYLAIGIRRGDQFEIARTRDLSQAGVGIDTRLVLAEDDVVQVALDGLHPIAGTVKWSREGKAGIAFDHELAWQTLMPWLREAQRMPAPRTAASRADETRDFGLGKDKTAMRIDAAARVREGARWWNVHIRMLSPLLVEFDASADIAKGTQLWIALPGAAGWPATVLEAHAGHYLAEFRLPLRPHDMEQLGFPRALRG